MNVYERINSIMAEVSSVYKGESVGYGNSKYKAVSHDEVAKLLHPSFVKAGLACIPSIKNSECKEIVLKTKKGDVQSFKVSVTVSIDIVNMNEPTDRFTIESFAYSFDTQDKAAGKAYSYAVKYALLKLFMLESSDQEEQRIELSGNAKKNDDKVLNQVKIKAKAYADIHGKQSVLDFLQIKESTELNNWNTGELKDALVLLDREFGND